MLAHLKDQICNASQRSSIHLTIHCPARLTHSYYAILTEVVTTDSVTNSSLRLLEEIAQFQIKNMFKYQHGVLLELASTNMTIVTLQVLSANWSRWSATVRTCC